MEKYYKSMNDETTNEEEFLMIFPPEEKDKEAFFLIQWVDQMLFTYVMETNDVIYSHESPINEFEIHSRHKIRLTHKKYNKKEYPAQHLKSALYFHERIL